jgi:hypothetical protein
MHRILTIARKILRLSRAASLVGSLLKPNLPSKRRLQPLGARSFLRGRALHVCASVRLAGTAAVLTRL